MNTINTEQLLTLALAYSEATSLSLSTVGKRVTGNTNHKIFNRLANRHDANTATVTSAFRWFIENWPVNAEWPKEIPRCGTRMSKQLIEESNIIEITLVDNQLTEPLQCRLRLDRVINCQLAIKIIQMIGQAESVEQKK